MNILITGASGFIGSTLCEESLKRKYNVWAGMREKSSRKWLQNEWLNFVTLDLTNQDILRQQITSFRHKHGRWDVIIHAGGSTKCVHNEDFDMNNFVCTRNLVMELIRLDMQPDQFLYLSSLSVMGEIDETKLDHDTPHPNTEYGKSKLKTEEWLKSLNNELKDAKIEPLNYTIFRPTGVYGPKEKDYLQMVKSVKNHVDMGVGFEPQKITFVYVRDLADAILSAIGNEKARCKTYNVSDGEVYSSRDFSDLIQKELGTKFVLHITFPLFVLKAVCRVSDFWMKTTGKLSVLNNDKYNILSQRNWLCDITPIKEDLGYEPKWNLAHGVKETIKWYKDNNWI